MNKSKFLKKSLAAVLAVLMIVAMIPLSAAAEVFKPTIYVDNLEMDNSGTTYTVTKSITPDSVYLSSNLETADGILWVVKGEDEFELTNDGGNNPSTLVDLTKYATSISGDVYTLKVEQRGKETDNDGVAKVDAEYTLVITNGITPIDKQTAITKVVHDDLYDPASYKIEGNTITMILPFGATMPEGLEDGGALESSGAEDVFVPASKADTTTVTYDGTAAVNTAVGKIGEVVVSVTGGTKKYDVKVEYKDLFANLSVEGEVEHKLTSKWDGSDVTDPAVHELLVTLPYGTAASSIVPTFTLGNTIKKIEFQHGGTGNTDETRTLTSGMTLPMDTNSGTIVKSNEANCQKVLKVTRDDNVEINVTVKLVDKTDNPEAVLKSIEMVGEGSESSLKSVKQDVAGPNVTVEMPVSFKGPTATLNLVASVGAKVEIVGQGNVTPATANASGVAALTGVTVTGANNSKTFEILVTSKDGESKARYRITWKNAQKEEALLKSITFQEVDADGKVLGTYSAVASNFKADGKGNRVAEISVPYRFRMTSTLSALKVFAVPSTGATVYNDASVIGGQPANEDMSTHNGDAMTAWFYNITTASFFDTGRTITVKNPNADPGTTAKDGNEYIIKFKAQKAKTGHGLRTLDLTDKNTYSQVTADNTFKGEIGTIQTTDGKTVNAVKVTVPYSWAPVNTTYAYQLKLDDGAKLLGATEEKKALDPTKYGNQSGDVGRIPLDNNKVDTLVDGKLDITASNKSAKLYVVNEEAWVDYQGVIAPSSIVADIDTLVENQDATIYYVYGVKAAPETGSEILSVESTLDENVTAKLNKDSNTIDITVPWTYKYQNNPAGGSDSYKPFSLNFNLSKLAKIEVASGTGSPYTGTDLKLKSDLGSTETENPTQFYVANDATLWVTDAKPVDENGTNLHGAITATTTTDGSKNDLNTLPLVVTAEDEKTTSKYSVVLHVAEKQMGAELLEVSVNGTKAAITAGSTIVNLTLPVGTTLNPQKLNIKASKMANVTINGQPYKATNSYDLSSELEIVVKSEGDDVTNTYTLRTETAKGFSDVKSGDWFYDYVGRAVAANIIRGYEDGTFKPYNNISRQDFALMVYRMMGGAADPNATIPFTDAGSIRSDAKDAVAYCVSNKIINGYEDATFRPNATITREEAAKMLAVALNREITGTSTFVDSAKIQSWAQPYVAACQKAGIFGGDEANRFNPQAKITRAETAKVMVKSLEIK